MCELLATFWSHEEVFTRQSRYQEPNFKSTQGTTKRGLISPTLFNVVVDNVVRAWLEMNAEYHTVVQEGLCLNVGICLGFFYANGGMIRS